ncbi:uncharacterized protein LOC131947645 [Physella acuta]|uniref:uncharacterized protein LOC131947645 n=1 Tax=Physella acuta TaxID=109671 RepID=UPI0027DC792F|nr:uncharacterized protein LOC131947645 [Physella acuta]
MYLRVLGLLAALAPLTWSSTCDKKDPCCRYDVDGCSIPFGLPFFYKGLFTPSCDRHDICYHCGVAFNISRTTCDLTFRYNTLKACDEEYNTTRQGEMTSLRDHKQTVLKLLQQKSDEFTQPLVDEIHFFQSILYFPRKKNCF